MNGHTELRQTNGPDGIRQFDGCVKLEDGYVVVERLRDELRMDDGADDGL